MAGVAASGAEDGDRPCRRSELDRRSSRELRLFLHAKIEEPRGSAPPLSSETRSAIARSSTRIPPHRPFGSNGVDSDGDHLPAPPSGQPNPPPFNLSLTICETRPAALIGAARWNSPTRRADAGAAHLWVEVARRFGAAARPRTRCVVHRRRDQDRNLTVVYARQAVKLRESCTRRRRVAACGKTESGRQARLSRGFSGPCRRRRSARPGRLGTTARWVAQSRRGRPPRLASAARQPRHRPITAAYPRSAPT